MGSVERAALLQHRGIAVAVAVDYYELLNISRSATEDQIHEAVKNAAREWHNRTEAEDASVRQEAEFRVQNIEAAREILTDQAARAHYDQHLAREGLQQRRTYESDGGDWLDKAKEYLSRGDYRSAAHAAREATQIAGNSAENWWLRSRASVGMDRLEEALYEAQQAADLEAGNADYHFHLGSVAEAMDRHQQALNEYQEAARLAPNVVMHQLAVAGVYLECDMPEQAMPVIEAVHRQHPDDEKANFYLASALLQAAEKVPAKRGNGSYTVTSRQEISKMRELVGRASVLKGLPRETLDEITRISSYLDRMEKRRFHIPWGSSAVQLAGPIRSALGALVVLIVPAVFAISGLFALFQGDFGGFLVGLIFAAVGYGLYKLTWVPQWKVSSRVQRFI